MSADEDSVGLSQSLVGTATMRIAGLHKIDSFYTPLEERFERITRLGKNVLGVRAASVTLIAEEMLWFKSVVGWRVTELPLKDSLQQPMLDSGDPVIVPDTHSDLRYAKLPLVTTGSGLGETLSDLGHLAERELLTTDLWNAQTQLVGKLDTARRQALLDSLTRVWNRRGGMELLEMVLQESVASGEQFAVCLVDIDHFKAINDQHGHRIGDQALRKIAASITASIRPEDMVSRYGGDEFLVILRDATPSVCKMVGERICSKIEETRVRTDNGGVAVTVSVGMAVSDPNDGATAAQVIDRADKALYQTKDRGRNGATVWTDDLS